MSIFKKIGTIIKMLELLKIVNPYHTPVISFPFNKRDSTLEEH